MHASCFIFFLENSKVGMSTFKTRPRSLILTNSLNLPNTCNSKSILRGKNLSIGSHNMVKASHLYRKCNIFSHPICLKMSQGHQLDENHSFMDKRVQFLRKINIDSPPATSKMKSRSSKPNTVSFFICHTDIFMQV